jgi:hypothetical protein
VKVPRGVVVLACLAACSKPSGDGKPAPSVDERVKAWHEDLAALTTELSHHPNFAHAAGAGWRDDAQKLDQSLATLDDAHIITEMIRLTAALHDSHTRLFPSYDKRYPVQLIDFEDGLYVAGAEPAAAFAIGKKVTAIDHRPVDAGRALIAALVPAENDAFLSGEWPYLLENPTVAEGTGLAHAGKLVLSIADGSAARDLELVPGKGVDVAPPKVKPLHLDAPGPYAYWNKYVAEQHLLYLQYNACENDKRTEPFSALAASTLEFVDSHPVDRFVIDLRSNQGGNSAILEPLISGLENRPALLGRVFVLIGRTTFSSAVIGASELATKLGAVLVGTPTGGNPNGYGEIKVFHLPHSQLIGQHSTKLFADKVFRGNTIEPDVRVHVVADDWFSGRDPAMDAVLAATVPASTSRMLE